MYNVHKLIMFYTKWCRRVVDANSAETWTGNLYKSYELSMLSVPLEIFGGALFLYPWLNAECVYFHYIKSSWLSLQNSLAIYPCLHWIQKPRISTLMPNWNLLNCAIKYEAIVTHSPWHTTLQSIRTQFHACYTFVHHSMTFDVLMSKC